MLAPFAVEEPEIVPTEFTPEVAAAVVQLAVPIPLEVRTCPFVPAVFG